MKAVVYEDYGPPEVLRLREVDMPVAQDDEVLVRVHAASVNQWDWDFVRGKPLLVRLGGWRKPQYNILGADIAGVVEAVGGERHPLSARRGSFRRHLGSWLGRFRRIRGGRRERVGVEAGRPVV